MQSWRASLLTIPVLAFCLSAQAVGPTIQPEAAASGERFVRSLQGWETCLICHCGNAVFAPEDDEAQLWLDAEWLKDSAHAALRCVDCHTDIANNGHQRFPVYDAPSPLPPRLLPPALASCIGCHPQQYQEYSGSAHGYDVLAQADVTPPFCTDCHGVHYILAKEDPRSRTHPANIASTCLRCHSVKDVTQRYDLTMDVAGTYQKSFHGLRAELGEQRVAVCTTCHSNHAVFRIDDPRSRVKAEELAAACGECHEGARYNFAAAFSHQPIGQGEKSWMYFTKQAHMWLIVLCLAVFLTLVGIDCQARLRTPGRRADV